MNATLYDDVLGTLDICIISKYCKNCKVTIYPSYMENYGEKNRVYCTDWKRYGIFMSTASSSFSIDFMERSVCLKLKCHTTFIGRTDAYNLQWRYEKSSERKLDKRTLADSYYKYTLLCLKERYNLPLCMDMDVNKTLKEELPDLLGQFTSRASAHECDIKGCKNCIVIDGHMKAHRKICKHKNCVDDPTLKSKYCEKHASGDLREIKGEVQVLCDDKEYHIEKIISAKKVKKRRHYEVKWVGAYF